jgi:predicted house-cleaning noncanonical NTP pyrophosphatase (MazG superfamily)
MSVENKIQQIKSAGHKVRTIVVLYEEYKDWLDNVASDEVKELPKAKQRSTYAAYMSFKLLDSN